MIYWLLLPINLVIALLAWMLAPILPLFANSDGWLPSWLWIFQTPDASLDGDSGWKDISQHPFVTKLPRYLRQVLWLFRNPSYGFNWTVLVSKPLPKDWSYRGNIKCDRSLDKTSWVYVTCGKYWQFRCYLKYPKINYCFQINIGWNIHEMCVNGAQEGQKAKYRFTPHPFKKMN